MGALNGERAASATKGYFPGENPVAKALFPTKVGCRSHFFEIFPNGRNQRNGRVDCVLKKVKMGGCILN
jgi:hypothetical protein